MIVGLFPQSDEGDTTMADRPRMTAAQLANKLLVEMLSSSYRQKVDLLRRSTELTRGT